MRLVIAALVLAVAAAPRAATAHRTPAAHAAKAAAHRTPARPPVDVRATLISGNNQTARAYAATAGKYYITEYPVWLVVAVSAAPPPGEKFRRVRFRCVSPGCILAHVFNTDDVNRLNDSALDVDVINGRATLRAGTQSDHVGGTYVVVAKPFTEKGERPIAATFTLVSR